MAYTQAVLLRVVGWILGIVVIAVHIFSAVLVVHRRNELGLLLRSWKLMLALVAMNTIQLQIPIVLAFGRANIPCWFTYFFGLNEAPGTGFLVLAMAYRLHILFNLERHKHRIARHVARSEEQAILLASVDAKKRSIADAAVLARVGAVALCFLALTAGAYAIDRPAEPAPSTLKCISGVAYVLLVAEYLVLLPPAIYLIYQLRKTGVDDAFGMRSELKASVQISLAAFVVYEGINASPLTAYPEALMVADSSFVFLLTWITYRFVLLTTLKTFPRFRARNSVPVPRMAQHGDDFNFLEFLNSPDGFRFLRVHLQKEFSEEVILGYRASVTFVKKPEFNKLVDIFHKFIEPGAPLQVNLSAERVRSVMQLIDQYKSGDADTPAAIAHQREVITAVAQDLCRLMHTDSFPRFMRSSLWADYLAGRPPPAVLHVEDQHEQSRTIYSSNQSIKSKSGSSGVKEFIDGPVRTLERLVKSGNGTGGGGAASQHHRAEASILLAPPRAAFGAASSASLHPPMPGAALAGGSGGAQHLTLHVHRSESKRLAGARRWSQSSPAHAQQQHTLAATQSNASAAAGAASAAGAAVQPTPTTVRRNSSAGGPGSGMASPKEGAAASLAASRQSSLVVSRAVRDGAVSPPSAAALPGQLAASSS